MRLLLTILVVLGGAAPALGEPDALPERGTAVTDPLTLRELDSGRFGLGRIMMPAQSADLPLSNARLFSLPSMKPVRAAIDAEFERYIRRQQARFPNHTVGIGASFDLQLFDRALLESPDARFVLAGIVNRMDRGYLTPSSCGEIRLIYRLTRTGVVDASDSTVSPRLPMTLNVVLKARVADRDAGSAAVSCSQIARRWLAVDQSALSGADLTKALLSDDGPFDLVRPATIDRIETNLQIAYSPKSAVADFRTDYLLKVFHYDFPAQRFEEAPLENQIDRERIMADRELKQEFRTWLLDPAHLGELDRGTILIPEKFLATGAIAPTPAGFANSDLQPAFGLVQGDGVTADPAFTEGDVVEALGKAAQRGEPLRNIRSLAGFERRLNDITCSGCHQTRGIGGFHFPGVDWMAANPSNAAVVPASPHFFGDQVRRRDILMALRDGRPPDYSRGFSSRPQTRGSAELAGTEYEDGWGAHCYVRTAKAADDDISFRGWTCAEGLACQVTAPATRMGMCFVKSR